jgi:hypothetical protein
MVCPDRDDGRTGPYPGNRQANPDRSLTPLAGLKHRGIGDAALTGRIVNNQRRRARTCLPDGTAGVSGSLSVVTPNERSQHHSKGEERQVGAATPQCCRDECDGDELEPIGGKK